jgi:antidote-toxin recognition MazE-like antitoxin
MTVPPRAKPTRRRSTARRTQVSRLEMRLIELWVPDVRSAAFAAEAHRQSQAVAQSGDASADQDFVDAIGYRP